MPFTAFASGDQHLLKSAYAYLKERYEVTPKVSEPLKTRADIDWEPALQLATDGFKLIVAEPSQTAYPQIFRLKYADLVNIKDLLQVYCVCPEEIWIDKASRKDFEQLKGHGFGVMTVDRDGDVVIQHECVPLVQHIPQHEIKDALSGLTRKIRRSLKTAVELYRTDPVGGVAALRTLQEALLRSAARQAERKKWLPPNTSRGAVASILDAMTNSAQFGASAGTVGGIRNFISEFGNLAAHKPKTRKQEFKKYHDCKRGFVEGMRHVKNFRIAMKRIHIRVTP